MSKLQKQQNDGGGIQSVGRRANIEDTEEEEENFYDACSDSSELQYVEIIHNKTGFSFRAKITGRKYWFTLEYLLPSLLMKWHREILIDMDLDTALQKSKLAIHYFFNNQFEKARQLLKPYADKSMYHAMGMAVFSFLEAVLTFNHEEIEKAAEELKKCLSICDNNRRKNTISESIGKTFKRSNFSQFTDLESHAELCSAETLLLLALLTFIEDETLSSLIRGSIKIRQCYRSYKECAQILQQRQWNSKNSEIHFESGVRMGIGTFNLMISMLPSGIIKILEFIGFSGNKELGLSDLIAGYNLDGLRQVLCAVTLLGYNLFVCYVLGHQEGDLEMSSDILARQLELFPEGVFFLFFKGRLEFVQGNLDEAARWYIKAWRSQNIWPQFHHLSFWELIWTECLRKNWREACQYATYLFEQSRWSRTIYAYQKASIMQMMSEEELSLAERQTLQNLMRDAPTYKQRIAGKSLPMEKFVLKKTARYFAQGETLCLPAVELMYLWNIFKVFRKNYQIADGILQLIEQQIQLLEASSQRSNGTGNQSDSTASELFAKDNYALCLLLRGSCYRQMNKPALAMTDLLACVSMHKDLKEDSYLAPYASVEAALVHADEQRKEYAISLLEETKKRYSGYSLESRLHFRIHAALMDLRS